MLKITDANNFRRTLAGLCLIAAPLVILIQEWIAPEIGGEGEARDVLATIAENPGRYQAAAFLGLLAAILLIPALLGLVRLLSRGKVVLGHVGGALALIGAVGFACNNVFNFLYLQMVEGGADLGEMIALRERVKGSVGLLTIELMFAGGLLLGLVLLAIALWRGRVAPRWASVLIVVFVVADFFLSGNGKVFDLIVHALLVVGLGGFGWSILRMSDADWERGYTPSPTEVGVRTQPRVQ